jgi:predicted  nucleic acid-binding Zn-ribbon protein
MSEHPLALFIEFTENDRRIHTLNDRITKVGYQLTEQKKKFEELDTAVANAQRAAVDAQKNVDAQELEMSSLDTRGRALQKKLDATSSPKEYSSLSKELAALNQERLAQETAVVDAWRVLEKAQDFVKTIKNDLGGNKDTVKQDTEKLRKIEHEMVAEREVYEKKRDDYLPRIPAEWLEKYNTMRNSVDDPVVAVDNNACGACSHHITMPEKMRLERSALIECKNCYRFMYLPSKIGISK